MSSVSEDRVPCAKNSQMLSSLLKKKGERREFDFKFLGLIYDPYISLTTIFYCTLNNNTALSLYQRVKAMKMISE